MMTTPCLSASDDSRIAVSSPEAFNALIEAAVDASMAKAQVLHWTDALRGIASEEAVGWYRRELKLARQDWHRALGDCRRLKLYADALPQRALGG